MKTRKQALRVEIAGFPDCPNCEPAAHLVSDTAKELGIEVRIVRHNIESKEQAMRENFHGSPSILIEGRDVEPAAEQRPSTYACRVYRVGNGMSGVPDRALLRSELKRHAAGYTRIGD
ncbi:DF family (seleno)protein [Salinispira pacifica]